MTDEEIRTGWLDTNGKLYPCKSYEHIGLADVLLKDYGFNNNNHRPDETLLNNGWVKITITRTLGLSYKAYSYKPMTELQKQFLKPYVDNEYDLPIIVEVWNNFVF